MIRHDPLECYTRHSLDEYPPKLAKLFRDIAKRPNEAIRQRRCILLHGPEGAGKSSLVGAMHKILAAKKRMVYWVSMRQFPDDYKKAKAVADELKCADGTIVVFDDIGKEPKNVRSYIGDIIDARAELDFGVDIFTTNMNYSEDPRECQVAEYYGTSIRSRILDMCLENVVFYDGPDLRGKSKRKRAGR